MAVEYTRSGKLMWTELSHDELCAVDAVMEEFITWFCNEEQIALAVHEMDCRMDPRRRQAVIARAKSTLGKQVQAMIRKLPNFRGTSHA